MLVTDPAHAIPVVVERSGLRTVAYGARDGSGMVLPNIPLAADVRPGDKLLTSGLGGRFPPGFPVGKVESVGLGASGMFRAAQVQPAADIDRSEDVLLLHDQAEPAGPPTPAAPSGPPTGLAPAPGAAAGSMPAAAASFTIRQSSSRSAFLPLISRRSLKIRAASIRTRAASLSGRTNPSTIGFPLINAILMRFRVLKR